MHHSESNYSFYERSIEKHLIWNLKQTNNLSKYFYIYLRNSGKIDNNIQNRVNKGMGSVNTIISLVEEISFGEQYFEMALLFRNSMLINSMLLSSEVLYGVKKVHLEMLESVDKSLLVRLFGVPNSCSYEAVYLETGILPVRFILQGRRLMYYWTLINKSDDELVKKVFEIQKEHHVKDDWILQVKDDLQSLDIDLSEDDIKVMNKENFKNCVKKKLKEKATAFLMKYRDKHSKTENLKSFKLQSYLTSNKFTNNEKKLLFSLRTRSVHVKRNYKNKYKFNMTCSLCDDASQEETEIHLLKCKKITDQIKNNFDIANATYEDIFSESIEAQLHITKMFNEVFKMKKVLLHKKNISHN